MKHSVICKIKESKKEVWLAWGKELETTYREVVLGTLDEEGVRVEASFVFSIDNTDYVVGIMEGDEIKSSNMSTEVNQIHNAKKKECLEFITRGESVYFFNR